MFTYIYIYICIYWYIHIFIFIYFHIYICFYIYIYIHVLDMGTITSDIFSNMFWLHTYNPINHPHFRTLSYPRFYLSYCETYTNHWELHQACFSAKATPCWQRHLLTLAEWRQDLRLRPRSLHGPWLSWHLLAKVQRLVQAKGGMPTMDLSPAGMGARIRKGTALFPAPAPARISSLASAPRHSSQLLWIWTFFHNGRGPQAGHRAARVQPDSRDDAAGDGPGWADDAPAPRAGWRWRRVRGSGGGGPEGCLRRRIVSPP